MTQVGHRHSLPPHHVVWLEDVTQGPTSRWGQPAVGATTMCKYVVDRWREREVGQLEHYGDGIGDLKVERSSLLQVASPNIWGW